MKSGMAALEEWLQQEYVSFFSDEMNNVENASNKPEFLASKIDDLFLKEDSSRNYVINGGRTYYLLNKSCTRIPKEVRDGLRGGDTTDVDNFIRLIDVYGITEDLKVFYIDTSSGTTYGNVENYKIDPALKSMKALGNSDVASQLSSALNAMGFGSTPDNITVGQISTLSNFTLNGQKENGEAISGLTDLSAISDATSLETLTLENLNLSSMTGLEKLTKLYYLYLRNVTCEDYSALCNLWELTHLFIYMPSATMDEATCNAQVINLGEGLANASKLSKLEYFGISGVESLFTAKSLEFSNTTGTATGSSLVANSLSTFVIGTRSNLTNLGTKTTGLGEFNSVIKDKIKYVLLNCNSFSNVSGLVDFSNIYELHLMSNKNLYDISGITNHSTITYLTLQDCALGKLDSSGVVADYRATGLTELKFLSIENNTNLTSLQGLENSSKLESIIGFGCNLLDIAALGTYTYLIDEKTGEETTIINQNILNPHKSLSFLNLQNNLNLVNVDSLGCLTGLTDLYMQGCSSADYDSTYENLKIGVGRLANTYIDSDGKNKVLFLQLANSYNGLDSKYHPLFTTLIASQSKNVDYSTRNLKNADGTGRILNDDDPLITAIRSRTDIELLNLGGQINLEVSTINSIIANNSDSLKYLGLEGLTQIEHLGDYEGEDAEWVTYRSNLKAAREANPPLADPTEPSAEGKTLLKTLPALDNCSKLAEIDIRGTNRHVSMRQITEKTPRLLIILDNTNINVNELKYYLPNSTYFGDYLYGDTIAYSAHVGDIVICDDGDNGNYNFDNWESNIISINSANFLGNSQGGITWYQGTIDLSKTSVTSAMISNRELGTVVFPKTLESYQASRGNGADDFSRCINLTSYTDVIADSKGWSSIPSGANLSFFRLNYSRVNLDLSDCLGIKTTTTVDLNNNPDSVSRKYYLKNCFSLKIKSDPTKPAQLYNLSSLVSTTVVGLENISFNEQNPTFYTCCDNLTLENTNLTTLTFQKESLNALDNTTNITLKNCSNLTAIDVIPDNLSIGSLDINGCPISSDYMSTLCSRFYRDGNLIINSFSLKSDSLASTATVGTQWVKPLLELHAAGLTSIKIGGKYVDSQAIEWLKNGVEIDGVEYAGFGASNVTIYN